MSSVTTLGYAAGIDLNQAFAAKGRSVTSRLSLYDQQANSYNSKLSAYAKVRGRLDDLAGAANAIAKLSDIKAPADGEDSSALAAVKKLVETFNAVRSEIGNQTGIGPGATPGALTGDAALRAISTSLQGAFRDVDASSIGLSFDSNGDLKLDSAKFEQALKDDPKAVKDLLQGDGKGNEGLAKAVSDAVTALTKPGGALSKATGQIGADLRDLAGRQSDEVTRAAAVMETYRIQYTRLDMLINGSNAANSFFSDQLALLGG
ncbi:flagellar filament capping protein FliD [Cupriavidus sp. 2SB]|uniref:flagellar filament capping protein FliD n=1 Tax=Cupriavidus sp. 2SB TaxID=2502199 RepID=UPI0010F587A4|nr:flagellar filament capping protein FliD [Cupriavidus sp. 2SB]